MTDGFKAFWQAYGYKVDKKAAERAWVKGKCDVIADEIIAAIPAYKAYLARNTWQSKKNPATWLNGQCWENEYPAPVIHEPVRHETEYARHQRECREALEQDNDYKQPTRSSQPSTFDLKPGDWRVNR